ncbi:MAG: hypothetical protein FJ297_02635 [Planctomycetes bacterium]|nr:hypothetical protein [Planctomycetota bacterium]
MRSLGKLMQVVALVLLPLSMVMQLTDALGKKIALGEMLLMLIFGSALFAVGRIVEGYGR